MNVCHFLGRLTHDPEVRNVNNTSVVNFNIALSRKYKTREGKKMEEVSFIPCEAWGTGADTIGEYFKKGDPIIVHASVKQETWEADGQKRSKLVFRVNQFEFVPSSKQGNRENDSDETGNTPAASNNNDGGNPPPDDEIPF
jgi:single-strand DNA-binding protein